MEQWIAPQIWKWIQGTNTMAYITMLYSQTANDDVEMSLQHYWQFLQHVALGLMKDPPPIEAVIWDEFIFALLDWKRGAT